MNAISMVSMLAVLTPLIAVIPATSERRLWVRYLAVVPAAILIVMPATTTALPWFLLGSALSIDNDNRAILAAAVAMWVAAITMARGRKPDGLFNALVMLTMAGHLGAILAADVIAFFCFSAVMGYGFSGMLVQLNTDHRASRLYVICLVAADLALFEALLIAGSATSDLRFDAVQSAMPNAASAELYLAMVLLAFALRAGLWPLHFWISGIVLSARPIVLLLLIGIPMMTGLRGLLTWLPLGESAEPVIAALVGGAGFIAVIFAAVRGAGNVILGLVIGVGGLAAIAIGLAFARPAAWNQYEFSILPGLAIVLTCLAGALLLIRNRRS